LFNPKESNDGILQVDPITFTKHVADIVMVGGGGAAALAAVAARQAGATVAWVTKESSSVSGATIMSAGGTSVTLSPGDSSEAFFNDQLANILYFTGGTDSKTIVRPDITKEINARIEGGFVHVPKGPSLGIELNEDLVNEYLSLSVGKIVVQ